MGLSQQDVIDIHGNWSTTMTQVYEAIVDHNGFAWQLLADSTQFGRNYSEVRTGESKREKEGGC